MAEGLKPTLEQIAASVQKVMTDTHGHGGLNGVAKAVQAHWRIPTLDEAILLIRCAVGEGLIPQEINPFQMK